MITADCVEIHLSNDDMLNLVAEALTDDVIRTTRPGYTVNLSVNNVYWNPTTEKWEIGYYLSAETIVP